MTKTPPKTGEHTQAGAGAKTTLVLVEETAAQFPPFSDVYAEVPRGRLVRGLSQS